MAERSFQNFWREATAMHGSMTPYVVPHVLAFGFGALVICILDLLSRRIFGIKLALEVAPHEIAGAALGLLLILRTNAGHERWWEARRLWGGIVNQSRNFAISALSYGPEDPEWRERVVSWAAAFPHIARASLRGEEPDAQVVALLGPEATAKIAAADHMPSYIALVLAELLKEGRERNGRNGGLDDWAFLQADRERALLIDHIGGCERILKTPLPLIYAIKGRRIIVLFLVSLPFALLHKLETAWMVPLVTMMVAYPLISLDQIGVELQNPFSVRHLSHLPLDNISAAIERNLKALPTTYDTVRQNP